MKKAFLLIIFVVTTCAASAQEKKDTLRLPTQATERAIQKVDSTNRTLQSKIDNAKLPGDSTARAAYHKVDSIRSGFQAKADSLQLAYKKPLDKIDATSKSLQHKIDSLQTVKLPTSKLTAKLDSVKNLGTKKIAEMNQKVEKLKGKATESLKSLNLPPEMQGPMDKLQQSVGSYKVPMVDGKIPDLGIGGTKLPSMEIPKGVNISSVGSTKIPGMEGVGEIKELKNLANETKELTKLTGEAGKYGKDVQSISKGKLGEVKNLDKKAEEEAKKMVGSKELDGMTGDLEKYKKQLGGRPDSAALSMAKQEAKEMVMKEATNHFAGKEEILKGAMDKMAKLKTKYSEVKSMADLPKRLPNPLHGKPLIERLVPGITLQFMSQKDLLLDVNLSVAYRISPRFQSGLGWIERITFASWLPTISDRVYGLRNYTEFKLPKGFSARADIEYLNAVIPPLLINSTDIGKRDWEWSILVGLKKDFKIFKSVTGNIQTMYRLWSDHDKVPFPDRLNIRMGFGFPLKKKK
ncbi:MAG: hypothetical protein ACKVOQ_13695 [Cyclobacteriaceae bacterium]